MADPRFYDNRGPFSLADVCAAAAVSLPEDADRNSLIHDIASLGGAGRQQFSFFSGAFGGVEQLLASQAGYCFVPRGKKFALSSGMIALPADSPQHAFAAVAEL